jgi:hypothetical protein
MQQQAAADTAAYGSGSLRWVFRMQRRTCAFIHKLFAAAAAAAARIRHSWLMHHPHEPMLEMNSPGHTELEQPGLSVVNPSAHGVQAIAPAAVVYVPWEQAWQVPLGSIAAPALQHRHVVAALLQLAQ